MNESGNVSIFSLWVPSSRNQWVFVRDAPIVKFWSDNDADVFRPILLFIPSFVPGKPRSLQNKKIIELF